MCITVRSTAVQQYQIQTEPRRPGHLYILPAIYLPTCLGTWSKAVSRLSVQQRAVSSRQRQQQQQHNRQTLFLEHRQSRFHRDLLSALRHKAICRLLSFSLSLPLLSSPTKHCLSLNSTLVFGPRFDDLLCLTLITIFLLQTISFIL